MCKTKITNILTIGSFVLLMAHITAQGAPGILNDYVTFEPKPSTYNTSSDPTSCPNGFAGKFSFEATLTNMSDSPPLSDLVVEAETLTNGNLLQNADGEPKGVGARKTVPRAGGFLDGVLSQKEFVDVPFVICLRQIEPFTFVVNVLGGCVSIPNLSPDGIDKFLKENQAVDSAAKFLECLPTEYKQNWIMMSRSESLQTGTATSPRLLLPSLDFRRIFTFTLEEHANFPLARPDTVEYIQFIDTTKRFGFHEIDLAVGRVSKDDPKCMKCHSGRPNWDAYDSWGGMLPFNRDRIYKGSVEAAAMRNLLNLRNKSDTMRAILEQLLPHLPPEIRVAEDGSIKFPFDPPGPEPVLKEPPIDANLPTVSVSYSSSNHLQTCTAGDPPASATDVRQGGIVRGVDFFTIHHSAQPTSDEGRGVELFDNLTKFNAQWVAQGLIDHPRTPVDIRPIALAIAKKCVNEADIAVDDRFVTSLQREFFERRNGMNLDQLFHDTLARRHDLPRRKADLQRVNLIGPDCPDVQAPGLIEAYGVLTAGGVDESVARIRQEVFRRPHDLGSLDTVTGVMIDRERYHQPPPDIIPDLEVDPGINTQIALFRFFLEPLGVPVDKWSMSVLGRSRTYTFADVFSIYLNAIQTALEGSLQKDPPQRSPDLAPPYDCPNNKLITASKTEFMNLPTADATPAYTEVQRIFNRSCTECHGNFRTSDGKIHGPYKGRLDLSEGVSYSNLFAPREFVKPGEPLESELFTRLTRTDALMMPQDGPPLSRTDIETIKRWIEGGATNP